VLTTTAAQERLLQIHFKFPQLEVKRDQNVDECNRDQDNIWTNMVQPFAHALVRNIFGTSTKTQKGARLLDKLRYISANALRPQWQQPVFFFGLADLVTGTCFTFGASFVVVLGAGAGG
jgi:hypothetical protein